MAGTHSIIYRKTLFFYYWTHPFDIICFTIHLVDSSSPLRHCAYHPPPPRS